MQTSKLLIAFAALAMTAPAAFAQPAAKTLVNLSCESGRCTGRSDTAVRDMLAHCRLVAREVGPVSQFRVGGRELSDRELRACNRFVIQTQPARN